LEKKILTLPDGTPLLPKERGRGEVIYFAVTNPFVTASVFRSGNAPVAD
jgi:hypothetical protein